MQSLLTGIPLESLLNILLRNVLQKQCLLLSVLRYCCPKLGRYYHPPSGVLGAKIVKSAVIDISCENQIL